MIRGDEAQKLEFLSVNLWDAETPDSDGIGDIELDEGVGAVGAGAASGSFGIAGGIPGGVILSELLGIDSF